MLPAGRHRESSYDSSGKYYLDTPFSSNVAGHFAGGEWRADFNHNQLMAVTNSGQKSTNALLTLHYDNGEKSYEMQQSIQPGDQMWVNVAELIRSRTPDRKGNLLPVDLSYGTFDLRDLTPANDGLLISSVALDMTMGYNATQPCVECCGFLADSPTFDPYPAEVVVDGVEQTGIEAVSGCSDDTSYISSYFTTWGSLNSSIAAVTAKQVKGVAAGTTTGTATGTVPTPGSCVCTLYTATPSEPVNVAPQITSFDPNPIMVGVSNTTLTINGSGFGSSPTVTLPAGITSTGQGSTDSQIILQGVSVDLNATIGNNNVTVTAGGQTSAPASLTIDGPYHMVVQSDATGLCSGCRSTVMRTVTYQVQNFSGTPASTTWMGENISVTGWSCSQSNPGITTAPCSNNFKTNTAGVFSDQWSLGADGYTPAGCGDNVTDHWQWCAHSPTQTLGTLTGYTHTNAISINGTVSPNSMPPGTVVPF